MIACAHVIPFFAVAEMSFRSQQIGDVRPFQSGVERHDVDSIFGRYRMAAVER